MFEVEGNNLRFKFVDVTASGEDIMLFGAIYTDAQIYHWNELDTLDTI